MKQFLASLLSILVLASCSPSREELAANLYAEAVEAFSAKRMIEAKILLDSMKRAYPDVPNAVHEAKDMLAIVSIYEYQRSIRFLDSVLRVRECEVNDLMAQMQVDDKNAPTPLLVHKSQNVRGNARRCFLRAYTDQNGNFSLSSNYFGERPIHHSSIRVGGEHGDFVTTDNVTEEPFNHTFSDGEFTWETVKYSGTLGNSAASFIADNVAARVSVSFIGEKSHYSMILSDADKNAIAQVWTLSVMLKETVHLKGQIRSTRMMINKVKSR